MARAKTTSLMLQILSIAAMAGQAAIGGSSNDLGEAGAAIMHGGNTLAMRSVLAYRRAEESAADQAAAMLLNATKQSTRGMLETFEYFAEQGLGSLHHVDPYIQSHPMPRQRMVQLRNLAKSSPYYDKLDTVTLQRRHDMVKAKLAGFLDNPRTVLKRYPQHDNSLPAQYARAVAYYRSSGIGSFLPRIEAMIKSRPDNPYLYELKGQFLFESGRAKAAIAPLQKAVQMLPESGIIRIALAQAMLAYGEGGNVSEAIVHLRKALVKEDSSANGFRQLAIAYGRKNKIADAELASAQAYFYEGKLALAKKQAKRALEKFKRGSPAWIKANDIINFQKPK
jgi:predicted Zn-dependent protease